MKTHLGFIVVFRSYKWALKQPT